MSIEQMFVLLPVIAVVVAMVCWIRREQQLASSRVEFTSTRMSRELLEKRFVEFVANRGRDRCRVFEDHIASQPNHLRWTLALDFAVSHDESGAPVMLARTRHLRVYWIPYPRKYSLWPVIDRWYELASRQRALIRAIRRDDPDVQISVVPAMFGPRNREDPARSWMDAREDGRRSPTVRASRESECRHGAGRSRKAGRDRYAVLDQTRERDQRTQMTEYLVIFERNTDGWWRMSPIFPGVPRLGTIGTRSNAMPERRSQRTSSCFVRRVAMCPSRPPAT